MKVRILKSFGSTLFGHRSEGQICDLPEGADWVIAGLAEPIKETKQEAAVQKAAETAAAPKLETKSGRRSRSKKN